MGFPKFLSTPILIVRNMKRLTHIPIIYAPLTLWGPLLGRLWWLTVVISPYPIIYSSLPLPLHVWNWLMKHAMLPPSPSLPLPFSHFWTERSLTFTVSNQALQIQNRLPELLKTSIAMVFFFFTFLNCSVFPRFSFLYSHFPKFAVLLLLLSNYHD